MFLKSLTSSEGGIIACEIANIYSTLGSEVNVIARSAFLKELSSPTKRYVLEKIIPDVNVYENTNVKEVFKNKIALENGDEMEGIAFLQQEELQTVKLQRALLN